MLALFVITDAQDMEQALEMEAVLSKQAHRVNVIDMTLETGNPIFPNARFGPCGLCSGIHLKGAACPRKKKEVK